MSIVSVSYDGFDLSSGEYRVADLNPMGSPAKDITMLQLARTDGSLKVFERYEASNIVVSGYIVSTDKENCDAAIDALKKQLRRESGSLEYDWGSGVRIRQCTCKELQIPRGREHISWVPYTIVFECESPFATDGNTETLVDNLAITSNVSQMPITVNGTYDAQPIVTVTFSALNPTDTDIQVTIANAANSQYLTVEETFTSSSVLVVNCAEYRAFLDGNFVRSTGQFPYFASGSGTLEYSDTATSRTLSLTATAEKRFL